MYNKNNSAGNKEELNSYLLNTLRQSFAPVTFSGDCWNVINRFLVKSVDRNIKTSNLEPAVNNGVYFSLPDPPGDFPATELERNWRYYISQRKANLYFPVFPHEMFSKDTDKYIYFLNGVYCNAVTNIVVSIRSLNPIKVWINGRIAMTASIAYNTNTIFFAFTFQKGMNTMLLEREFFPSVNNKLGIVEREVTITIKPVDFFDSNENRKFFDEGLLEELKNGYAIIPEKALFKEREIRFVVLPQWFDTPDKERIQVTIKTAADELLKSFTAYTGETIQCEIEDNIKGVLIINAMGLMNSKKALDTYIFFGSFTGERALMLQKAGLVLGEEHDILKTMRRLVKVPDICNEKAELAQEELYGPMLKNYAQFENAIIHGILNEEYIKNKGITNIFENSIMLFEESEIDDGFVAYRVYLPENYSKERRYPLVLELEWGFAFSTIPRTARYIRRGEFEEAIIVTICARGELNHDFINEIEYLRIIDAMLRNYNIDRERIYGIAVCTAATKVIGMAIRKPDLFSGLVNITGIPRVNDIEYLRNIENLTLYNLITFDDYTNVAMFAQNQPSDAGKVRNYFYKFHAHGEFNSYYNSGSLLKAVVNETREKYPKMICLNTQEPVFNKSFWICIDIIEDLRRMGKIAAEIVDGNEIRIIADNIKTFSLLLGAREMNLEKKVAVQVNGIKYKLEIEEHVKVIAKAGDGGFSIAVTPLECNEFQEMYESIAVNEDLLGLKQVYLKKCVILRPDIINRNDKFLDGLFQILSCPLKERLRNYQYEVSPESAVDEEILKRSNFVIYINPSDKNALKEKILKFAGVELGNIEITYREKHLSGDYFGLFKIQNPFNPRKQALLAVCNSPEAGEEMIKFLNTFDDNPLFYSDAVIYNNGEYYSMRDER